MSEGLIRRIVRDVDGGAYLWLVFWDDAFFHFRTWRLDVLDVEALESWERATAVRRMDGEAELPPPQLRHPKDERELSVMKPEEARSFLIGKLGLSLDADATEFFCEIARHRK